MPPQHLLDLDGIDVLAAADDHVLQAVDDEECAVVAHAADVAGAEPAIDEGGCRGLGVAPVAWRDHRSAAEDLAHLEQVAGPAAPHEEGVAQAVEVLHGHRVDLAHPGELDPAALGAFNRWQDAGWKRASLALR